MGTGLTPGNGASESPATGPAAWLARLLPEPGPGRLLALGSLIASIGNGLYIAGSVVYFVRYVGLSPTQVGIGLSVGGFGGLLLGPVLGRAADRIGARTATMLFTLAKIGLLIAAGLVHTFLPVVAVVALLGVADSGEAVSRSALVAGVMGREGRVRLSAYIRSVFNLGITLGIFLAGLALAADTGPAYLSLIWGHALALLIVLPSYLGVPHVPGVPARAKAGDKPVSALRDLPYFALGQVSGITRLGDTAFTVALPLWIIGHTSAPRALAAWVIGLNTVMVVLLQVRAARSAETLTGAVRLQRWSFIALAAGCALAGLAGAVPTLPTIGVLVIVTVFITFGEMWGEGARWSLRYELAPQNAQGQYGGVFRLGQIMPAAVGPLLVTTLTEHLEAGGWLIIAAVFLLGLALNRFVVPWAVRTRQSTPDNSPIVRTGH